MQIIQLNLATHWWSQKQLKRMRGITLLSLQTLLTRCRRDIPLPCLWMVSGIQGYLSFMCRCGLLPFLGLNSSQSYKDVSWGGGQEESTWTWALGGQRWPLSWLQDVLVKRLQASGVVVVMILCVCFLFSVYYFFASVSCSFPAFLAGRAARVLPHPAPSWPCPTSPILPAPSRLSLLFCPAFCNPPPLLPPSLYSPGNSLTSMLWRQQVLERAARLHAVGNNMHLMIADGGRSLRAAF